MILYNKKTFPPSCEVNIHDKAPDKTKKIKILLLLLLPLKVNKKNKKETRKTIKTPNPKINSLRT